MINANQARKLTAANRKIDITYIYEKIEQFARLGRSSVTCRLTPNLSENFDIVAKELADKGYIIKRDKTYDQPDGESWDYIVISW